MEIICTEKCEFYGDCKNEPIACADLAHKEGVLDEYIPAPRWPNRVYYSLIHTGERAQTRTTRTKLGEGRKIFDRHRDAIIRNLAEGMDYVSLGEKYGVKPNTLGDWVRKELERRSPELCARARREGRYITRKMLIKYKDHFLPTGG
jgi:hypothetical protein